MSIDLDTGTLPDEELKYWIAFAQQSGAGVGSAKIKMLHERFMSLALAWHATRDELKAIPGFNQDLLEKFDHKRRETNPDELLKRLRDTDIQAIASPDAAYPYRLRHMHDPPQVLYVKGAMPPPAKMNYVCAVVGTRKASTYGEKCAKDMAIGLASSGCVVSSGMAAGIDSVAHQGAIDVGGMTIAVVGCGVDVVYPPGNRKLYDAILANNGAIMSEHFPGTQPEKYMFPARNRIVSGISQAIAIVEAPLNSGALITAELGFHNSGEVFVIPGRVDAPTFAGSLKLVVQNKAHMITSYEDILEAMNWVKVPSPNAVQSIVELYGREKEIYELLTAEPEHFDSLCDKTGMAAGEMSATLTMLELAGIALRHPGDWYSRQQGDGPTPSLPRN